MLDFRAITKIQSIILSVVIVVAALGGIAAYVLLSGEDLTSETIKIGVCADLDSLGKPLWQAAVLAAEQVNAEGGVLGRNFTIVSQDDDSYTPDFDPIIAINAMTRLITVDEADFLIASNLLPSPTVYQELAADNKKTLFLVAAIEDKLTQNVLDNYARYKYFFRTGIANETSAVMGVADSLVLCREYTGFNKFAFLYQAGFNNVASSVIDAMDDYSFDVVLDESFSGVIDFSSYFAKAEAAGAEILYPMIVGSATISFVQEYYDRQSPMVMWGTLPGASETDFWQLTEGKCEHITVVGYPVDVGYPLTSKVLPTRDAYFERWGEEISGNAAAGAYDTVRFILPDAIERAGTIETDAVVEALEETSIETTSAKNFVFTKSHDVMIGENPNDPDADYTLVMLFQWQDGEMVPVYPLEIMEEAGATYIFPNWDGPWNK